MGSEMCIRDRSYSNSNGTTNIDVPIGYGVGDSVIVADAAGKFMLDTSRAYPQISKVVTQVDGTRKPTIPDVTTFANRAIQISKESEIPRNHHGMLVLWAVKEAFKKGTNPHLDASRVFMDTFNERLVDLTHDVERRNRDRRSEVTSFIDSVFDLSLIHI